MRHKRIFLSLLVIAALILPGGAAATVYDLKTDWQDNHNPNGLWSYNQGNTPLPWISVFYIADNQPAYSWVQWPGYGHTPIWLKAVVDNSLGLDVDLGDVAVHGTDTYNTLGSGQGNVTWTSPVAGTATISGNVWFAGSLGRSVDWFLYQNATLLASGRVWDGDPWNRDNPFDFGTLNRTLAAGDVIWFQAQATAGSVAHFVGVNLTIDAVPIPLPPAVWLLGSGLAGLLGLRKLAAR